MRTRKRQVWTLALATLCGGCGLPLTEWGDDVPKARGAFCLRSALVMPEEEYLDPTTGFEVAGSYQHTPQFAMEYSAGHWSASDKEYSSSHVTAMIQRVTALYSPMPASGLMVAVGGGLTFIDGEYKIGNDELADLESWGIYNAEGDIDTGMGFHLQAEVRFVATSGFTFGVFFRRTVLDVDSLLIAWDGFTLWRVPDEIDMGSTDIGLSLGARF